MSRGVPDGKVVPEWEKSWKNVGGIIRNFFSQRFVTIRKCQRAGVGGAGEAGFNGPAVVSPVKIDELRDNALVQSARY